MDGWMDGWMDWILLRSLVQLEHLAVLIIGSRQIGLRTVGPRTIGPQTVGPRKVQYLQRCKGRHPKKTGFFGNKGPPPSQRKKFPKILVFTDFETRLGD